MKKILFLDIDGVLNTERWHKKMMEGHAPKDSFGYDFDHFAMIDSQKCFLIDETLGNKIVAT